MCCIDGSIDFSIAETIVLKYPSAKDHLIALLQELQDAYGYLPKEVLLYVCEKTGIPQATLWGVVTFYAQFRRTPPSRHHALVCLGTACHVDGGPAVAEAVESALGVSEGETTDDGLFSFEKAACLGCCSLSPVMMIDGRACGRLTAEGVRKVFDEIRAEETQRANHEHPLNGYHPNGYHPKGGNA